MKAMVINFSGNAGKSTITKHLLTPRLMQRFQNQITARYSDYQSSPNNAI